MFFIPEREPSNRKLTINGGNVTLEAYGGLSLGVGKPESMEWVRNIKPKTVLDVGAGAGMYALLFQKMVPAEDHPFQIDAIEVWEPYIKDFELEKLYNTVYQEDTRNHTDWNYDLVIFGDVLEHMDKDEARTIWSQVSQQAKYALISMPIGHNHQDAYNGNPYEEHVTEGWGLAETIESFPGIFKMEQFTSPDESMRVGIFFAKF